MVEVVGLIILEVLALEGLALFGLSAAATASLVGTIAVAGVSLGLSYLLAPRPGAAPGMSQSSLAPPEANHLALRQAIPPRICGYGRNRMAGVYVLYEAVDGVSWDVLALHHGRIGGIIGYYLNDDVVTINAAGIVQEQPDGRYGTDAITIKTRLGLTPETAYSEVTAAIPEWTPSHRGDGVASLMLKCNAVALVDYYTIYPRGKPEPSAVIDCLPILDTRDSAQSLTDPDSWVVSSNPVIQLIDLLTNADYGMGFDRAVLITPVLADLMLQADICDEAVTLKTGGTEPRYRSSGVFALDADDSDKLAAILDTCDGWMGQNADGTLAIKVGKYDAPAADDAILTKHIRGFSLQFGIADEEAINELVPDYTDPRLDYKLAPGDPWRDEIDISTRGKERSQRFSLSWVQSHSQARRLSKRRMAVVNTPLRGTLTTTLYGLKYLGERWVRIIAPTLSDDLSDVVVQVQGATIDLASASVTFRFSRIDPNAIDAWDAETEEGDAPSVPAKLLAEVPDAPVIQQIQVGSSLISVHFADQGHADYLYQLRWRVSGSGSLFTLGSELSPVIFTPSTPDRLYINDAVSGSSSGLEIQVRAVTPDGIHSEWSTAQVSPYN